MPDTAHECSVCGTTAIVVRTDGTPPHDIEIEQTGARLSARVGDGRMQVVRGDVPQRR